MKRIKSYDMMRVICFCCIIFYHMVVQLWLSNVYTVEQVLPFYSNQNMHIATMAVAVFFMLSGACLVCSTSKELKMIDFYKKRFVRLLVPFWVVVLFCGICRMIMTKSIYSVFPQGIPRWRIIFTVFGVDEWLGMHGVATFTNGVGEWFLGALIVLNFLFPFFRCLMMKNKTVFLIIASCLYLCVVHIDVFRVPVHMNLLLKGYEFIIGMYLGMYFKKPKRQCMVISGIVVVLFFIYPQNIRIYEAYKITILAVSFFVFCTCLEEVLMKYRLNIFTKLSKCSYELFLVHHVVIGGVTALGKQYLNGCFTVCIMFLIQLLIMAIWTSVVKVIADRIIGLLVLCDHLTRKGIC